jgi:hypothetical protein
MESELKSLQLSRAELQGKADQRSVWFAAALALISLGLGVAAFFR